MFLIFKRLLVWWTRKISLVPQVHDENLLYYLGSNLRTSYCIILSNTDTTSVIHQSELKIYNNNCRSAQRWELKLGLLLLRELSSPAQAPNMKSTWMSFSLALASQGFSPIAMEVVVAAKYYLSFIISVSLNEVNMSLSNIGIFHQLKYICLWKSFGQWSKFWWNWI